MCVQLKFCENNLNSVKFNCHRKKMKFFVLSTLILFSFRQFEFYFFQNLFQIFNFIFFNPSVFKDFSEKSFSSILELLCFET